jgi:uncharacterized membrane protein
LAKVNFAPAPTEAVITTNPTRWQLIYNLLDRHAGRILFAAIVFYTLVFGFATAYRWETYQINYDQMYFEQPLWNTTQGRFLEQSDFAYSTSAFAVDWMPLLALFIPLYWLIPSPHTLFFAESLILALAALPIFWLARDKFNSRPVALAFVAVYMLNPTLQYFNILAFNLRAPALTCLLFAFFYFEKRKLLPFAIFALLAVATRTEVSLVVAMFGVYALLAWRREKYPLRLWLPPLVLAPVYFVFIFSFLLGVFIEPGKMVTPPEAGQMQISERQREYISNTDTIISTTYGDLGKNLPDVLKNTIVNPLKTAERVFTVRKMTYLVMMLLPFAFLPLFAPRVLVFALPVVAINLLSIRPVQSDYRSHYSALLIFPLIVGAIYGAYNLVNLLKKWRATGNLRIAKLPVASVGAVLLALGIFAVGVQASHRNPLPGVRYAEGREMINATNAMINRIPKNASVASTSLLGPHVMPRRYSYYFPLALYNPPLQAVQYILIDTNAVTLYQKENGEVFSPGLARADWKRPIDWLRSTPDFKLVDKVTIKGQKADDGLPREIQLWQRVGDNVPEYRK